MMRRIALIGVVVFVSACGGAEQTAQGTYTTGLPGWPAAIPMPTDLDPQIDQPPFWADRTGLFEDREWAPARAMLAARLAADGSQARAKPHVVLVCNGGEINVVGSVALTEMTLSLWMLPFSAADQQVLRAGPLQVQMIDQHLVARLGDTTAVTRDALKFKGTHVAINYKAATLSIFIDGQMQGLAFNADQGFWADSMRLAGHGALPGFCGALDNVELRDKAEGSVDGIVPRTTVERVPQLLIGYDFDGASSNLGRAGAVVSFDGAAGRL